jgi:hypothetical protein
LIQKTALLLAVCALAGFTRATAQNKDPYAPPVDPFAASPAGNEDAEKHGPVDLSACCEVFTLPLAQAAPSNANNSPMTNSTIVSSRA